MHRLDAAEPGHDRRRRLGLAGKEGDAREDAARPGDQRGAEVEGGTGRRQEPLEHQEPEVAQVLRDGAPGRCVGGRAEGPGRVERVSGSQAGLVGVERGGGRLEPLPHPARCSRRGSAQVAGPDLALPELGEQPDRGAAGAAPDGRLGHEARLPDGVEGQDPLRERAEERPAVACGGQEPGNELVERDHPHPEQGAALGVAQAALGPGLPERGGDDDEIGHRVRG